MATQARPTSRSANSRERNQAGQFIRTDPAERFWSFVAIRGEDDCWEYQGARMVKMPYGRFTIGPNNKILAHRMAWILANGSIPEGLHVLHSCDNPPCCNAKHLWLGTEADNNADKIAKGREHHPRIYSDDTIAALRALVAQGNSERAAGRALGVCEQYVNRLLKRRIPDAA